MDPDHGAADLDVSPIPIWVKLLVALAVLCAIGAAALELYQ